MRTKLFWSFLLLTALCALAVYAQDIHSASDSHLSFGLQSLMFTMNESDRLPVGVREVGAHGYVLNSQAARDLIRAIDYVLSGKTFFGASPQKAEQEKDKPSRGTLFRMQFAFAGA